MGKQSVSNLPAIVFVTGRVPREIPLLVEKPRHDARAIRHFDYVPQETLFWRKSLYEAVGGINQSFQFAMDWDLLLRFIQAGARFRRVPYFLACFRVHNKQKNIRSWMSSVSAKKLASWPVNTQKVGARSGCYVAGLLSLTIEPLRYTPEIRYTILAHRRSFQKNVSLQ